MQLGAPTTNATGLAAFVQYFAGAMVSSLTSQVAAKPSDSLFLPACLAHTSDTSLQSNTTIAGGSLETALNAWWTAGVVTRAVDTCTPVPCNPTCPPTTGFPFADADLAGVTVHAAPHAGA